MHIKRVPGEQQVVCDPLLMRQHQQAAKHIGCPGSGLVCLPAWRGRAQQVVCDIMQKCTRQPSTWAAQDLAFVGLCTAQGGGQVA